MMNKRIKNEQWDVKTLLYKINNKEISKPQFQRKKKWDTFYKNEKIPNEQAYIKFLFDTENSVHAITFGQESVLQNIQFSNIDGNNRINAIKHFIDKPFEIFDSYLKILNEFINGLNLDEKDNEILIRLFVELSYYQIINLINILMKMDMHNYILK